MDVLLTLCYPVQSLGEFETELVRIDGMVGILISTNNDRNRHKIVVSRIRRKSPELYGLQGTFSGTKVLVKVSKKG